jgi:hypothetical protein
MGTSHSWGEVAGKFNRLAEAYDDLPKTVVGEAALLMKRAVLANAPGRLRNVGKRGAKLSAAYNTSGHGSEAKALVFARGPWQIIEGDTRPHPIPRLAGSRASKKTGETKMFGPAFGGVNDKKRLTLPDGNVRRVVFHPGTKGQHPWEKGVDAARPAVERMFATQAAVPLRRIF